MITDTTVTISGTGLVGESVVASYGVGQTLDPVTVNVNGIWTAIVGATELGTSPRIAAIQTTNGMSSVSSDTVSFSVINNLSAPIITVPANGATNVAVKPTFSGTGIAGATVTVTANSETVLTATVGPGCTWAGVITAEFETGTEYAASAIQMFGTITSPESTEITFTTVSN